MQVVNRTKSLTFNLYDRFKTQSPAGKCPLTKFKIVKVFDAFNSLEVLSNHYNELFRIYDNGTFEVLKFDTLYKEY